MSRSNRRGSALLVVLGMIAFMVVSAVAFSAYMRYSRLPSSFLRQTSASRLLVKAALANAIDEVDAAIGNNPHPGVGQDGYAYPRNGGRACPRNFWRGRVYMGMTNASDTATADATVTPLCLEALAYLPPPLVNEVRYYSRHSFAACWHRMNFDAGRYAFCAVDVSDYFDVNALEASAPRSSEPESLVSLSYLFENPGHTSATGGRLGTANAWDSFMDTIRNSKVPLVSLADWNLAMNNGGPFKPPFCNYVENGPGNFYGIGDPEDDEAKKIRQMTFVTDSYFPPKTETTDDPMLYLSEDANQPWTEDQLKSKNPNAFEVMNNGSVGLKRLEKYIPYMARAALYDYLDEDRVPLSLALPTVERVPMICAIATSFGGTLAINTKETYAYDPSETPNQPTRDTTKTIQCNLDTDKLFGGPIGVKALVTYPFRHEDGVAASSFTYEGALLIFLTSGEMGLRPGSAVDRLKSLDPDVFTRAMVNGDVISLPLSASSNPAFSGDIDTEEGAVKQVTFTANPSDAASALAAANAALFYGEFKVTQTAQPKDPQDLSQGYDWSNPSPANDKIEDASSNPEVLKAESNFRPLTSAGAVDTSLSASKEGLVSAFRTGSAELRLNVAVVLRVKLGDKTVDMVPACGAHDKFNGQEDNWQGMTRNFLVRCSGSETPLLRMDTGATFVWSKDGFKQSVTSPKSVALAPAAMMIGDPRYNYAPECWFKYADSGSNLDASKWLAECGAHEADGDIFMQVSDQRRLQSVYELANLPRVGSDGMEVRGAEPLGGLPSLVTRTTIAGSRQEAQYANFMWKTYDPFGRYRDDGNGDGFELVRMAPGMGGFRVCPYSDSTNVLMAAFANTPHDWRCASVNNQEITADSATAFNAKYAWNEYSSGAGAKLNWANLEEVAGEFMSEVRSNPSGDEYEESWEVALRNLGWRTAKSGGTNNEKYLLDGLDLDGGCKVFNTDRKFLYGFWHDSFSARQQLFLVFVRAEPTMMGGGAIGQTPPQLGARAVALVWRDPKPTTIANAPHRTRVLFYRQFD